jgi:hypothetical protein
MKDAWHTIPRDGEVDARRRDVHRPALQPRTYWSFDGGITVPASSSPLSVKLPYSVAEAVDPEEAFVARDRKLPHADVSLCRGEAGIRRRGLRDEAVGEMTKNERGKLWVSKVIARARDRVCGRQAADTGAIRRTASPRARGVLHREFGEERGGYSGRDVVRVSETEE